MSDRMLPTFVSAWPALNGCSTALLGGVRQKPFGQAVEDGRSASSPQRSRHIVSVSPLSHRRSGWTIPRTSQPRGACQPRSPSTRLANRPYHSDTTGLISALCPRSRWRWKGDASSVARSAHRTNPRKSSRGVDPPSGGGAASRTDGSPVIAGTSSLVRVQAIRT